MDFIKTPVKGMAEKLPNDMIVREFVLRKIKDTYKKFGFMLIETPIIEHIENLTNKQGGENEQLIFKILKRGEKLKLSDNFDDLCDSGLRYDLTVPLARFYANNNENLPVPFKALQIGESFRADRPQKGRFRQFTQCDIDILADETNLAEIELISATVNMLNELGIKELKVRVNDREILKAMALECEFPKEQLDTVFIILDKLDKIGLLGVKEQLLELGIDSKQVEKYCKYFENLDGKLSCREFLSGKINIDEKIINNLTEIIESASTLTEKNCQIVFDPTLVRGMSYYTGPIFEIELQNYNLSVAGGGRYDKMIGKFCSKNVCACGFSIGLERIISVINENNLIKVEEPEKVVFLVAKNVTVSKIQETILKAKELRNQGKIVSIVSRNNNAKFQKEVLQTFGFTTFIDVYQDN